jgi:sugar (pentulose or hexulose) kinase
MSTKNTPLNCVAFDCGNSSLRTVVGTFDGTRVVTKVVSQVPNATVNVNGFYYWDILYIFESLKNGLREAHAQFDKIDSIGICTWGVDFGLLDEQGFLISNPLSYRNTIGEEELSKLDKEQRQWMFEKTGIQNNRINSLYQLSGIKWNMPEIYGVSKSMLMIPDLLGYLFTGEMVTEFSIASTTQMLDVKTRNYVPEVLEKFGIQNHLLKPLREHGEVIGPLRESIAAELGIPVCPVICVPSHDTACAVTAVPTQEKDFIFISSGTWSLIGTETSSPIINQNVYDRDFANEGGVFNSITLLKNSTGMHILQCIKKELELSGKSYTWSDIVKLAADFQGKVPTFDPNSSEIFNPVSMLTAIQKLIGAKEINPAQIIASAYASLAFSYRYAIEQIQEITGITYKSIYIVGGGSQNAYLNQLTADFTGKTVISGPKEATSLGNIGVQLSAHVKNFDINEIRKMVKNSEKIDEFNPNANRSQNEIDHRYSDFKGCLPH